MMHLFRLRRVLTVAVVAVATLAFSAGDALATHLRRGHHQLDPDRWANGEIHH